MLSTQPHPDENPRSRKAKIAKSRERSNAIAAALDALPASRDPKASPIDVLLDEWRAHIEKARARGCSDHDIARAIVASGCVFRPEAIRVRIRTLFGSNGRGRAPKRKTSLSKRK